MLSKRDVVIESVEGADIALDYTYVDDGGKYPVVIFAHGYKGFKDWGAWSLFLEKIALEGFVTLKFNFSGNGTTKEHLEDFVDLEAFGNNTYTKEQNDLKTVIEYAQSLSCVDANQVFIMGHSRGGGSVLLQAYSNDRVKGVISLAGVSDFKKRFPKKENFKKWQEEGVFYSLNGRTKQQMPHYFVFWKDFEANEANLTIQKAAQLLKKPTLLIHGTADEAVSIHEAYLVNTWIKGAVLVALEGANHVFGASHPFVGNVLPADLELAKNAVVSFLQQQL